MVHYRNARNAEDNLNLFVQYSSEGKFLGSICFYLEGLRRVDEEMREGLVESLETSDKTTILKEICDEFNNTPEIIADIGIKISPEEILGTDYKSEYFRDLLDKLVAEIAESEKPT